LNLYTVWQDQQISTMDVHTLVNPDLNLYKEINEEYVLMMELGLAKNLFAKVFTNFNFAFVLVRSAIYRAY